MNVEQKTWTILELVKQKEVIELTPAWQRGPAWKQPRQVLLIDSILRGMDIPKVYLRKLNHASFNYDAVDGQQRLRAIWMFQSDELALVHSDLLPSIDGEDIQGKKYSQLSQKLKDRFSSFKVSIGEITGAHPAEIRNLFARLQMGVSLNPAELRNAMEGPLRYSIDSTARLHSFFRTCRVSSDRYKHLDYAAHAYAIAAYQGSRDIKAADLRGMIEEYGTDRGFEVLEISEKVDGVLTLLEEINKHLNYSITQKWIFVDLFWLLLQYRSTGKTLNAIKIARSFSTFEQLRREYNPKAEQLLVDGEHPDIPNTKSKHMYSYINAFRVQGGQKANLNIRNRALAAFIK